jgi:hypothetical protein
MALDPNGDFVLEPDHTGIMLARMPSQFRNKPRMRALIQAIGLGVQTLEEEAFDVLISTTLPVATGESLNQWGVLVGEARGGLSDEDYRVFIEARILVNKTNGSPDELIEIFRLITAPQISIRYVQFPKATFGIWVFRESPMGDRRVLRVANMMRDAKPGGVEMILVEEITGYFGFNNDPGHPGVPEDPPDAVLGFDIGLFSRSIA